jgi:DNA-directed RNA polymerase specialized sigma24 family protein
MPRAPEPTPDFLRAMLRMAMSRGLPVADAEDAVARAWERSRDAFDPRRGSFEGLMHRVLDNECRYWWRAQQRAERARDNLVHHPGVALAAPPRPPTARERAATHQAALLERLDDDERRLFAAWALQKHLPQGTYPASQVAAGLGLTVAELNNAKKRLRTRIATLLDELGLDARDLYSVEDDEGPRRTAQRA